MTDATTGLPAGPERPTDATRAEPVAVVDDLTVTFATDNGAVDAVKGVSIDVRPARSSPSSANPAPASPSPPAACSGSCPRPRRSAGPCTSTAPTS